MKNRFEYFVKNALAATDNKNIQLKELKDANRSGVDYIITESSPQVLQKFGSGIYDFKLHISYFPSSEMIRLNFHSHVQTSSFCDNPFIWTAEENITRLLRVQELKRLMRKTTEKYQQTTYRVEHDSLEEFTSSIKLNEGVLEGIIQDTINIFISTPRDLKTLSYALFENANEETNTQGKLKHVE